MPYGQITRLEPELGFGWLVDESGLDWFFVREGTSGDSFDRLALEERVTFDYEWTPTGPRARDVTPEFPQQQPT